MKSTISIIATCILAISLKGLSAFEYSATFSPQNLDSLAKVYNNQGVDYLLEGNHELASEMLVKSLRLRESIPNFPKERLANGYINLASLKLDMSLIDTALLYYRNAESILMGSENPPSKTLGVLYFAYGNCLRYKHDYKLAITYIQKGINLLRLDSITNAAQIVFASLKLTSAYSEAGMLDDALKTALKAKTLSEKHNKVYYSNANSALGLIYLSRKDYAKAVEYFKVVEKLIEGGEKWRLSDLLALYSNLGSTHHRLGLYELADMYFSKGLKLVDCTIHKSPQLFTLLRNFALFKRAIGDYEGSDSLLFKSLHLNAKLVADDLLSLSLFDFYSPLIAVQCFDGLGSVYLTRFEKNNDISLAEKSLGYYAKAVSFMDEQRASNYDDGDMLHIDEIYHSLYLNTIIACFSISKQIPEAIELAFGISSKAKASILNQALRKERGLSFSGVPQELIDRERDLRLSMSALNERYHELKQNRNPSSKLLQSIENRIFDNQKEHRNLLKYIENEHPRYFAFRYDTTFVRISDVQKKLKPTQVLIDFIITDSALYSFALSKDCFRWEHKKLPPSFNESLSTLLNEINPSGFENLNRANLERFTSTSSFFYQLLLKPFETLIEGKELIIVPHQLLSALPFSALIKEVNLNPRGYYALEYLAKTTPISYYPSTKLFITTQASKRSFNVSSISYAPTYDDSEQYSAMPFRQNLSDLPGAEREATNLIELLGCALIAGDEATESHFKRSAGEYKLIHLAMHSYIDVQNHLFSKLIFSTSTDTIDDGLLNLYEVYGLKLDANLVILSACRGGDGSLAKGEGVLSLARGFLYAGAPSMVAAQWRVDDFSGSEIVVDFTKNLSKGMTKAAALQLAQQNFLNTADPLRSHPYFWASYQVIGDQEAIFYKSYLRCLFWVIPLIVIVLLLLTLKFFEKKS